MSDMLPDDFYVNYLPSPASYIRFTRAVAVVLLALFAGFGIAFATSRRDPGPAIWDDSAAATFTGVAQADPYPTLLLTEPTGNIPAGTTLLIVEVGKRGASARIRPLDGRTVKLTGFLLSRGIRRMLELEESPAALTDLGPAPRVPDAKEAGVELTGEIVDSKCYLGAMKPGDGRTHKECAMLCISGGVPPMLVTRNVAGEPSFYLLADERGVAHGPAILPLVADPVRVIGTIVKRGDLSIIRCIQSDISRLDAAVRSAAPTQGETGH